MDKKNNNGCAFYFGGGIWGILFLIMFVMKTMGLGAVANWSWWLVLMPIWISLGIGVILFIILVIYGIWLKKH